jgi:hypothetical protein
MSAADLAEFFFAAHPAVVQLQTIEITHPNFTAPLRFVRNSPGGIRVLHEDGDGPFVYSYLPMNIRTLGTTSSLDQTLEVTLGDVGELLPIQLQILSDGNGFQTKPVLIYREYRSDEYAMTAIGAPDWTFDGTDDFISMGDVLDFTRTTAFSMFVWYRSTSTDRAAIGKQSAASQAGYRFVVNSTNGTGGNTQDFILSGPSGTQQIQVGCTPRPPVDGNLHCFGFTYTGSSTGAGFTFYIDGVAATTNTDTDNLTSASTVNSEPLTIGKRGSNLFFDGDLEHVSIWNTSLSAGDVTELYGGGTPPDLLATSMAAFLVGWWKMDATDAQGTGGVVDYSTSGFDGTASGGIGALTGSLFPIFQSPMFGPFTLQVNGIAFNKTGCTFSAKPQAFNRARTGEIYDIGRFPMLVGFV